MNDDDALDDAIARERAEQGLPPTVQDPAALAAVDRALRRSTRELTE